MASESRRGYCSRHRSRGEARRRATNRTSGRHASSVHEGTTRSRAGYRELQGDRSMARSLRDELLRAGLVTSEQASRTERGSRPPLKSARRKSAGKPQANAGRYATKHAPRGEPRESSDRRPPVPVRPPAPDPEERVRQLNLEIRRILDTEAEKIEAQTDTPFHFARGDRLKRLYVSGGSAPSPRGRRGRDRRLPGPSSSLAASRRGAGARAAPGSVRVHRGRW